MIELTREEWQAALKRANAARRVVSVAPTHAIVEAILGPCPPEPAPEPWRSGGLGTLAVAPHAHGGVCVGFALVAQERLTPDEADQMAAALTAHARYDREQGAASDA